MLLVDTHCHIHEPSYPLSPKDVLQRAARAGVEACICVGTNEQSSKQALEFAEKHQTVFAAIGVHPHDTENGWGEIESLAASAAHDSLLVGIGEIGLDYFYTHSPRTVQVLALEAQIAIALEHNLPIIFHVRDAFDDFWPIFDNFRGIRGELHSFTDSMKNMEEGLKRGLFIGVNGISTFTKNAEQKKMFAAIPLEKMLLETDAPFLTPAPLRGKINEPAFVRNVAEFHAGARGLLPEEIALTTTANARALFAL